MFFAKFLYLKLDSTLAPLPPPKFDPRYATASNEQKNIIPDPEKVLFNVLIVTRVQSSQIIYFCYHFKAHNFTSKSYNLG